MERWLGRYSEVVYALMRMVVGLLFACHGAQKLFGVFGGQNIPSSPLMVTAGMTFRFAGFFFNATPVLATSMWWI